MKQFFILALAFATGGCNKLKNFTEDNYKKKDTIYSDTFNVAAGWDIYTGGVYRYGPSIIRHPDGSFDAWFAAPGGTFGDKVLYFNEGGLQSPVGLSGGNTAAQQFTAASPFYAINVACPN
ncbi:hypothetical protein [Chitinophaga sp.]|uniref:hypothetical protein n=1 Tax=Chitinophaga sp. TaxID=1869181 RepID=UPI002CD8165D|nr:hypothetical protein [Chitinophaga sp.]HWV64974.1 hypothetical protein [Chitinophaga sp.]